VTKLWAGQLGFDSWQGQEFFSLPPCPDQLWDPPSFLSNEYQVLFLWGVKLPGRDADHSPPCRAEVMNAWSYTSTPTTRLRAKFKHRVLYVLVLRNLTLCNILHSPVIFTLLRANILLSTLLSDTLQLQGGEREREREGGRDKVEEESR